MRRRTGGPFLRPAAAAGQKIIITGRLEGEYNTGGMARMAGTLLTPGPARCRAAERPSAQHHLDRCVPTARLNVVLPSRR